MQRVVGRGDSSAGRKEGGTIALFAIREKGRTKRDGTRARSAVEDLSPFEPSRSSVEKKSILSQRNTCQKLGGKKRGRGASGENKETFCTRRESLEEQNLGIPELKFKGEEGGEGGGKEERRRLTTSLLF